MGPAFAFIDATELRAAEIRRLAPGLDLALAQLQSSFSASSPDPAQRARDLVLAFHGTGPCVAECTDLLTMDGRSLRLELDSENARRFTRNWRETPVRLHLCVAMRRRDGAAEAATPSGLVTRGGADIEIFTAASDGVIADKPAGPDELGWDRLFVPTGQTLTLAQLVARGEAAGPRPLAWGELARTVVG
jgi:Ham1 family